MSVEYVLHCITKFLTMDINHVIILFGIFVSQIVMKQPILIRTAKLSWEEATDACRNSKSHLINFLEMKNRLEYFKKELVVNKNYWVAETWVPKLFFVKGCQSKINVLSTKMFKTNLFSECVTYCENQTFTTIGLQGSNCSCIVDQNLQDLEPSTCDLECAWNNASCRAEKHSFAVYQLAEGVSQLTPGNQFDDCFYYNIRSSSTFIIRDDCNKNFSFICQDKNGKFMLRDNASTWMEAGEHCSKENWILANINERTRPSAQGHYNRNYWIGIRQSYQPDMKSKLCSFIQKFTSDDLSYSHEDCSNKNPYLCVEDPASTTSSMKTIQRDENIQTTSNINSYSTETVNGGDTKYQMGHSSETAMHAQERGYDRNESGPAVIAGVVGGLVGTVTLVILIVVCLFLRKKNPRSKYTSPTVTFSSTSRRDSKISQDTSVKATPLKPARRSKKSNPASLAEGTAYENIVLTLEDPATISRVVSSSSTEQKQDVKDAESSYDVMGAFKTNNNAASVSQNVYGFSVPDNEYDVMDRGIRQTEEVNPDYDHM